MTSLLDIGPMTESVVVHGKKVTVHGVTPEGFFYIMEKFPELQALFSRGGQTVDMITLQAAAPASVAFSLALATTDRSEFDSVAAWRDAVDRGTAVALKLSAHYQMALFQVALKLTFPEGVGPFMKGVEALANSINAISNNTIATAPDSTSSNPSRSGFVTDSPGLRLGKAAVSASSARSAKSGRGSISASGRQH